MKGFSSKTLTIRLRELEKSGILDRQSYSEIPIRVEYRLTSRVLFLIVCLLLF